MGKRYIEGKERRGKDYYQESWRVQLAISTLCTGSHWGQSSTRG